MSDAGKAVEAVEKVTGQPVSVSTVIAVFAVLLALFLFVYYKIWPIVKAKYENSVNKKIKEKDDHDKLDSVIQKQKEHDDQFGEMVKTIRSISENVDKLGNQLAVISGENKVSISVLLDIVECMQAKTSPEECARRAQKSVNAYYREGKLPPAITD